MKTGLTGGAVFYKKVGKGFFFCHVSFNFYRPKFVGIGDSQCNETSKSAIPTR